MATWHPQPTDTGETGQRNVRTLTWKAVGMVSVQEALDDADFPVAFNDEHPDDSSLKARRVRINASGFKVYTVQAEYSVPEDGNEHGSEDPDETRPDVYNWQTVTEQLAIDRDNAGNPLISSAGRSVQGITQARNYKRLTITSWEATYSLTESLTYENTVNNAAWEGAAAGEVKCVQISPGQSYDEDSELIQIDRVFDFKAINIWGDDPWQTQYVDRDSFAFANIDSATKQVRIVTQSGEPVTDAPLDGQGRPLDSTLTYFESPDDTEPVASPSWVAKPTPTGATVITVGVLRHLRFETLPTANFTAAFGGA